MSFNFKSLLWYYEIIQKRIRHIVSVPCRRQKGFRKAFKKRKKGLQNFTKTFVVKTHRFDLFVRVNIAVMSIVDLLEAEN